MKSVLLSIQPKWCELIASGKKTVEIRKTKPKIETPFKCYIYQTKHREHNGHTYSDGKVIGEFICDYITPFRAKGLVFDEEIVTKSCLSLGELIKYTPDKLFPKDHIYAWHISDLVIYDEPKELREFKKPCQKTNLCYPDNCNRCGWNILLRPPQSWCYVEEKEE